MIVNILFTLFIFIIKLPFYFLFKTVVFFCKYAGLTVMLCCFVWLGFFCCMVLIWWGVVKVGCMTHKSKQDLQPLLQDESWCGIDFLPAVAVEGPRDLLVKLRCVLAPLVDPPLLLLLWIVRQS